MEDFTNQENTLHRWYSPDWEALVMESVKHGGPDPQQPLQRALDARTGEILPKEQS